MPRIEYMPQENAGRPWRLSLPCQPASYHATYLGAYRRLCEHGLAHT